MLFSIEPDQSIVTPCGWRLINRGDRTATIVALRESRAPQFDPVPVARPANRQTPQTNPPGQGHTAGDNST